MCSTLNEVPLAWGQEGGHSPPELSYSVVDLVATPEYTTRPLQPPVYVFLIDVSHAAIQSGTWILVLQSPLRKLISVPGMVATAARTLLENLDYIPNEDDETRISILAFDTSLYFFSMQVRYFVCALVIS